MGRPKSKGERSEVDEMLDAVAPIEPEPEEEIEAQSAAAPEPPAPKQITYDEGEQIGSQETEARKVAAEEDAPEDPDEVTAEADDPAPAAAPAPSPSPDPKPTVEQLEAANQGLKREMQKLREKMGARKAQAQMQAPSPVQPAPVPTEGPQPVALDDMIVFQDGTAGIDPEKFDAAVRRATAPDPSVVRAQENQQFRSNFINSAETPEDRAAYSQALARGEQAYEHLELALQDRADQYGVSLQGASHDQVVGFLRQSGVMGEISTLYPDVAPDLPAMLAASSMHSHEMMADVLRGYAARNSATAPLAPPPGAQIPVQAAPSPVQPLPAERAPSLASVGESPQEPGPTDRARFEALGKKFDKNPLAFPAKELKELERLEERFL